MLRKTKIVCTLGPSTDDENVMRSLIEEGMNVARFNFSHGGHEEQFGRLTMLRKLRGEMKRPVAALLDTKGPEIRLKEFASGKVELKNGQTFTLTTEDIVGDESRVAITYKELPDDVVVYFFGHSERDGDGGEKFKTIGKLLDEKVCVEGYFTIVLKTVVQDGRYLFSTRNDGMDTVKTPLGMFSDALIENDLAAVDKTIREYYNIPVQPDNKGE